MEQWTQGWDKLGKGMFQGNGACMGQKITAKQLKAP